MWRLVNVSAEEYMMRCQVSASEGFELVLYNAGTGTGFKEDLTKEDLLIRATELNRRIRYPQNVFIETLTRADPEVATLDDLPTPKVPNHTFTLSLKYKVNDFPLRFEWYIRSMTQIEQWECMVVPMLKTIKDLSSQVGELTQCVHKKDMEIAQFKFEGCELRRATLRTGPFNFEKFEEKYKDTEVESSGYQNITDYIMKYSKLGQKQGHATPEVKEEQITTKVEEVETSKRKRKYMDSAKSYLKRKIIQRRAAPTLIYKESQSQSANDDDDGDDDDDEDDKDYVVGQDITSPSAGSAAVTPTTSTSSPGSTTSSTTTSKSTTTPCYDEYEENIPPLAFDMSSSEEN